MHHKGFRETNTIPTQAILNRGRKKKKKGLTLVISSKARELGLEVAAQPAKNNTLTISQAQAQALSAPWAQE